MKDYISGVHDYCDRWCARCPLTHRCAIYEPLESLPVNTSASFDAEAFADSLSDNLPNALDIIRASVEQQGLDWNTFHQEALQQQLAEPELTRMEQTLKERAIHYGVEVKKWLDQNSVWLEEKEEEINTKTNLGIDQNALFHTLSDAIEVIQWYTFFLGPKISRAVRGLHDPTRLDQDCIQHDANGSAKISLIAINRSLSAWEILRSNFPERTDDLLDLFRTLAWLRRQTLVLFPHAEQFVRPGFDERVIGAEAGA